MSTYSFSGWCTSLNITETASLGGNGNQGNLFISGSLYNNGSILGSINYYLHGNLVNNLPWTGIDSKLKFTGQDHLITCSPGADINAQFLADDSLQNLILNSDLEISNETAILGNSEMYTQNHVLRIHGGSFQDCRIHAFDTLHFNAIIGNLAISGSYKLKGNADILGNLNLEDEAVNYGKIQSFYGASSTLKLYGDFINEDTIGSALAGNLNVNVIKSAVNHGFWNANVTMFMGSGNKHISQTPGHPFGGTQISSDNSGSTICLDSDVEFTAPSVFLNNNTLNCGTHAFAANSTFDHGTIISESEIQGNSDFWTTSFKGNLLLSGNPRFSNCSAYGNIENIGHMQAITFYGGIFSSYGLLDNKGDIQGIHFNIYGNLSNNGNITDNCIVDVVGDTVQYILLTNSIESQCYFYSDITGTSYQWMLNGADIINQQSQYLFFNTLQISDAGIYQCRVTTDQGTVYSREIIVNNVTSLPEVASLTEEVYVFPNPFAVKATIHYEIAESSDVAVMLLDQQGRPLKVISEEKKLPGIYEVVLDESDLTPGLYMAELILKKSGERVRRTLKLIHR